MVAADATLGAAIAGHRYAVLCRRFGFRYFTTPADRPLPGSPAVLYDDGHAIIYGLC